MQLKKAYFCLLVGLSTLLCFSPLVTADYFDANASYQVYFTPTHNCTREIVRAIDRARHSLYVQAYFLTAEPIISALLAAKTRQVDVKVILDKNHRENEASIKRLLQLEIPVWIDQSSGIAHNKVMIIDEQQIITGSFNFTYSAQHKNRENILLIKDKGLAKWYLDNWHRCQVLATQKAPLRKLAKGKVTAKKLSEMGKLWTAIYHIVTVVLQMLDTVLENISIFCYFLTW